MDRDSESVPAGTFEAMQLFATPGKMSNSTPDCKESRRPAD